MPSEIEVNQGDQVRLIITSIDMPHTFTLMAYGINEKLPVGKDVVIEFVAERAGTFTFACDIPGHEERGMIGQLIVT